MSLRKGRALDVVVLAVVPVLALVSCGRGLDSGTASPVEGTDGEAGVEQPPAETSEASTCPHVPVEARCKDGFCLIPAGCFVKGSPVDEPYRARYGEEQYEVTLSHSFLMQDHETTQAEWVALGYKNLAGSQTNDDGGKDCTDPSCPASTMTWLEATKFANEKSVAEGLPACVELTGCTGEVGVDFVCTGYRQTTASYYDCEGYRIPTMFEFEYAKRAGTSTAFYSGPAVPGIDKCIALPYLDDTAWYCANAELTTHPVKQKRPNAWGLHDMMGNVDEFVSSNPNVFDLEPRAATDPHSKLDADGRFGMADGPYFSWPGVLRSARMPFGVFLFDLDKKPTRLSAGVALGFRLVRTVSEQEAAMRR